MSHETVGSLLAIIANSLNDGLRTLMFADKRAWGPGEFEQLRLLEDTLDEAKKDFQELPALVNGQFYYESDRTIESLEDLRILCTRFELHSQTLKDWARTGGPINALWARETLELRHELHQAQCRAARRIHETAQPDDTTTAGARCLGALQVYRAAQRGRGGSGSVEDEEAAACRDTGKFERLGDRDVAFICDFCDGYLVWEDLRAMPTRRSIPPSLTSTPLPTSNPNSTPASAALPNLPHTPNALSLQAHAHDLERIWTPASSNSNRSSGASTSNNSPATQEHWQASGTAHTTGEPKPIVFAPVAIANHRAPGPGAWQARVRCPFCDDAYYEEQGDDDMERVRYAADEAGFASVREFQEHLEWYHASGLMPGVGGVGRPKSCGVM
ncbi:hypothetical protein F5B20DRAFT_558421 [Whalleya microplaca]|nr:hypothetical protein F5B20DRAFT_558421 [Whalleya microplaca]